MWHKRCTKPETLGVIVRTFVSARVRVILFGYNGIRLRRSTRSSLQVCIMHRTLNKSFHTRSLERGVTNNCLYKLMEMSGIPGYYVAVVWAIRVPVIAGQDGCTPDGRVQSS